MNAFLFTVLGISLLTIILITVFGWKTKSNENLILFQSLPLTFIYSLLYVGFPLQRYLFPGEDSEGYGMGFVVMIPSGLFLFISMTILGIRGMTKWKEENDKFLLVTSLACVSIMISLVFTHFLYPFLTLYILGRKAVRKLKGRKESIA
ncbi:hypothetical protein [Paenisporosarcina sp. TG-14]|uniref:hypothetical protein n=1 Tax=Paenisporosarcina sp. TG-14 TaxID=1231057 RepID=UPI00035E430D|nr:hypothetical protein [Paenisporosarcina sp. TG-14]